jgi:hypothetical protein
MVTLALGAIGVINIMLVAVSERTHEIGLRKALGATNRSILFHFFLEGMLLTLGSGLLGMGMAAGLDGDDGNRAGAGWIRSAKLVPMSAVLAIGSLDAGRSRRRSLSRAQSRHAATRGSAAAGVNAINHMFRDLLQEAYGAMRHNRRRTALTMLGMAWGIATVVMLLAYGDGFGQACANIFANFGTKLVIVVPGRTSMQAGGQKAGALVRFTEEDIDTLTTNLPQISRITPEVSKQASVQYDTRVFTWAVTGNYPNVIDVRSLKLGQGRFYNMEDQMQRARVAVLGSEAKEKLFSGRNALGEHVRVDGLSFEVIGVLKPKCRKATTISIASLRALHHHGRLEEYSLLRFHLVHLSDSRVRSWNNRSAPSWRPSTSSTRPTTRPWKCSTS